jgi:hypothetical protein
VRYRGKHRADGGWSVYEVRDAVAARAVTTAFGLRRCVPDWRHREMWVAARFDPTPDDIAVLVVALAATP